MKALGKLKREPGIWLYDAPMPQIGPNDVLIKIRKTAICGTDLHIYKWDEWAQKTVPVPMTIGHEFVGTIEKVGSEVKGFKPGDRVSGEGHLVCGACRNCRAGNRHLCRNVVGIGYDCTGAFAEYFSMPAENVMIVPDEISDDIAAFFDPLGNAVHTALSFDLVGEDVLITGAGPLGIMGAAIARHAGARHVVVTEISEYRIKLAEKVKPTRIVNIATTNLFDVMKELGINEGFSVGLEMSGNAQAFVQMIDAMNNGGKIALLGLIPANTGIDWPKMIFKILTIKGIYGREIFGTWHKMMSMLQSGLNVAPVVTHILPVSDYNKAFEIAVKGQAGKIILDWT